MSEAPATIVWIKPSGLEIELNDRKEIVEYCESLKWVRKKVESSDPDLGDPDEPVPDLTIDPKLELVSDDPEPSSEEYGEGSRKPNEEEETSESDPKPRRRQRRRQRQSE